MREQVQESNSLLDKMVGATNFCFMLMHYSVVGALMFSVGFCHVGSRWASRKYDDPVTVSH